MKKLNYIFFLLLFGSSIALNAQNVNIPDANFKAALVANAAINTNGDGEIQVSEAAAFTGTMGVNGQNIADLTGIEAFTALVSLFCGNNQLTSLNLSSNTSLTLLYCANNQLTNLNISSTVTNLQCHYNELTSLNLSSNTALTLLYCHNNQLTNLNISSTVANLHCYNNQLTSLNLSSNTALISLQCSNNQLTSLNVKNGNNINMSGFSFAAINNPNLLCIEVDSVAYSNTNWASSKDSTTSFSTDCSTFNSTTTISGSTINLTTYPNPTNGNINISLGKNYSTVVVELRNIMGQMISSKEYNGVNQVDMNIDGAAGVYFANIRTEEGEAVVKVVKE